MRLGLVTALTLLTLGSAAAQDVPALSNDDASKGIAGYFNRLVTNLMVGERSVAKDLPPQQCSSRQMSLDQFTFLLDAEKAGYVEISYDKAFRELTKDKLPPRAELLALAADGKVKLTALPTKKAETGRTGLILFGRNGCISYKTAAYTLHDVTSNEPRRVGDKQFRIVGITYRVDPAPLMRDVQAAADVKRDLERKANVLVRYNPDRQSWDVAAFDAANAGDAITSKTIEAYLEKEK
jgi:hypothetical protein